MFHEPILAGESLSDLVQIAGLVRFSYPCEGGFQREFTSRRVQSKYLYAPARMEERFRFFEALCPHSLKAQTDKAFSVGVLIGEDMPAKYKARLEALLAGLPQATLIALPYLPYAEAMRRAYACLFSSHAPLHLSFRLDDDDAVAIDFIAEVRARLPQIYGMSGGLDPARRQVTALRYEHQKLHQNMPVLMDPHPLMNLRAFHGSNDSPVVLPAGRRPAMSAPEIRAVLQRRFALDMDKVLAL